MIKIQARMVVIPHTVCLTYSSNASPGFLCPTTLCMGKQGLFTYLLGLSKQAALTFRNPIRGELWVEGSRTFIQDDHTRVFLSLLSCFEKCSNYSLWIVVVWMVRKSLNLEVLHLFSRLSKLCEGCVCTCYVSFSTRELNQAGSLLITWLR